MVGVKPSITAYYILPLIRYTVSHPRGNNYRTTIRNAGYCFGSDLYNNASLPPPDPLFRINFKRPFSAYNESVGILTDFPTAEPIPKPAYIFAYESLEEFLNSCLLNELFANKHYWIRNTVTNVEIIEKSGFSSVLNFKSCIIYISLSVKLSWFSYTDGITILDWSRYRVHSCNRIQRYGGRLTHLQVTSTISSKSYILRNVLILLSKLFWNAI